MKRILRFTASWCGPCKSLTPFITYLKEQYENGNLKDELRFHTVEQMKNLQL